MKFWRKKKTSFKSCDNIFWHAFVLMWSVETTHYFNYWFYYSIFKRTLQEFYISVFNIASIFNCYFHIAFMLWTMCYFIFLCLFSIGLYPLFLVEWRNFEERKTSFRSCDNIFWHAFVLMWNVETTHYFNYWFYYSIFKRIL